MHLGGERDLEQMVGSTLQLTGLFFIDQLLLAPPNTKRGEGQYRQQRGGN
jgi:hypothetical protein